MRAEYTAGNVWDEGREDVGDNFNIWTSSLNADNPNNAWNFNGNSNEANLNNNNRYNGQSVRGVLGASVLFLFFFNQITYLSTMRITPEQLLLDLYAAYYEARKGKGSRNYVKKFDENLHENLVNLRNQIMNRTYSPGQFTCFVITHPKKREIFASQFTDRIVHHLYFEYLHEYFENTFIADCYSCIKKRGTSYGINRLRHHILSESQNYTKECWVLKLDISGYFMSIDRKLLLNIVKGETEKIKKKVQNIDFEMIDFLSEKIITNDPTKNCKKLARDEEYIGLSKGKSLFTCKPGCGLPIGNLTSQLYSNIYLNRLDQFVKRKLKMKHYGRYVDDLFIVSMDKNKLLRCVSQIRDFLKEELHLELNEGKTHICRVKDGAEFLGAYIKPYRTYISNQCVRRVKTKLAADLKVKSKEQMRQSYISRLGFFRQFNAYNLALKVFYGIDISCIRSYLLSKTDSVCLVS